MIQRIQSVYLLLMVFISVLTIISPVADLVNTITHQNFIFHMGGISQVKPTGQIELYNSTWVLTSFAMVFGILSSIALFSFKKRMKQIRLCMLNFVFLVGYYILLTIFIWSACKELNTEWHLRFTSVLPLIALILNVLAIGAIGKDEKLVKSLDRIR